MSSLAIVIPCYNEERRLPKAKQAIANFFGSGNELTQIVLVNDGSRDRTLALMQAWQRDDARVKIVTHSPNRGKGYAIKQGMQSADADWILFMDADMATPMNAWQSFRFQLSAAPVLIGTRKGQGSVIAVHQPWLRENMGKVFTWLSGQILGVAVSDFTCGFKAFRRDACAAVFARQQIFDWSYDAEILYIAQHLKFAIKEIPVTWTNDVQTKVSLIRDSLKAFWGLLCIRFKGLRGNYR